MPGGTTEEQRQQFCLLKAKQYGGIMPLWIYQTKYEQIEKQNLRGVCYAITTAWEKSQYAGPANYAFVNSLRLGIPQLYLDQQAKYLIDLTINAQALTNSIELYLENMSEVDPVFRQALVETYMLRQRLSMGADCVGYRRFSGGAAASSLNTVLGSLDTSVPVNYKLSFVAEKGGGHVVGLGFRADYKASSDPRFPAVYYLIDANFGYFVFGNQGKMLDFFNNELWRVFYAKKYAKCSFTWGKFAVGRSDRSYSQWEQQTIENMLAAKEQEQRELERELEELELDRELEDLELELELEELENELTPLLRS